ncbi:N-acetylmuramoyl-L-alanine amidase [Desulfonatronovibrio hydrogenovorans]|uniref:N-acetylmuramoyl-L-alanine amidase n=1 Tax=Desulfonatronovibrio hydrogenovorans TaxID=53245 RepID=UPI00048DC69F|nr:N-acetylmuramoyl-L-alanine amidase [Desulfonatronovibrio hydrogenovorans]
MKISRHKLGRDHAAHETITKTSGRFTQGLPDTIVIHYTAGSTLESALSTFKDPDVRASAHVVVDKDGSLTQLVPFDHIAWHAGQSAFRDRTGLNRFSIGIELVNAGRLEKNGSAWSSWFGRNYPQEQVVQAVHRNEKEPTYWERFTPEQIDAVFNLCSLLKKAYNIKHILGHEEISPGRKIDPGPAFPLDKLRDRLLHADRSDQDEQRIRKPARGMVRASALNIRTGPSAKTMTIAHPLSKNTELDILDQQDGWLQVKVQITGWVSGRFVEKLPG